MFTDTHTHTHTTSFNMMKKRFNFVNMRRCSTADTQTLTSSCVQTHPVTSAADLTALHSWRRKRRSYCWTDVLNAFSHWRSRTDGRVLAHARYKAEDDAVSWDEERAERSRERNDSNSLTEERGQPITFQLIYIYYKNRLLNFKIKSYIIVKMFLYHSNSIFHNVL